MAVRIIGESPQALRKAPCSNCGAILEFTNADTRLETHKDYGGGSDTYRVFNCPRCSHKIQVSEYERRGFY